MLAKVVVVLFGLVLVVKAAFEDGLPTKENVEEYFQKQYLKSGMIGEKYDGALYDDMNFVVVDEPIAVSADTIEDDPKVFNFVPPEATVVRGKRAVLQGAAPVTNVLTGAAVVAQVDDASDVVPYDAHIDPDFPAEAPVARGLQNIPEGWNLDKEIDWEFKSGYRHGGISSAPAQAQPIGRGYAPQRYRMAFAEVPEQQEEETVEIEGPYIATADGLRPLGQLQTFQSRSPYGSSQTAFRNSAMLAYAPRYGSSYGSAPVASWG
uniref:ZM domain-containing protein n=2 Tax=Panagrellus redivivus TaxID=6233 RepID=A0A7E4URP1_PANRE